TTRISLLLLQRKRVDAVAQAGRRRAIREDVAEMAAAVRARHFGADHTVAGVAMLVDHLIVLGRGEAGPAAAGIELCARVEQRRTAAGADEGARALAVQKLTGERSLRALLAQHVVAVGAQFLQPLLVGLGDFGHETILISGPHFWSASP